MEIFDGFQEIDDGPNVGIQMNLSERTQSQSDKIRQCLYDCC